uniref:Secreted protein n=1 Tax=Arundo donax TaxID=35708 RepID=A0A0A9BB42_ARUDO
MAAPSLLLRWQDLQVAMAVVVPATAATVVVEAAAEGAVVEGVRVPVASGGRI